MEQYQKSLELSDKFQKCLRVYADMLGAPDERKVKVYGFRPGLQTTAEAEAVESQLSSLREGIFQVMFMGGFNAGKSTTINALMRRSILRRSIKPETAAITKIIFGKEDERAIVHMKAGHGDVEELSVSEFFTKYRVDQEDTDKFKYVDYVILHLSGNGIAGTLVQLVDSPGTENSETDTTAARNFAEKVNAIVYVVNSTQTFPEEEREYIVQHFAAEKVRNRKNIFFVCNWYNTLDDEESRQQLRSRARLVLRDVFLDESGNFNEELFRRRVFYVDALESLKIRTGQSQGNDEDTGIPAFEEALSEFLTSDDRDTEAFRAYIPQLANYYVNARDAIGTLLKPYTKGRDDCLREKKELESKRERLETIIEQILESCKNCVAGIVNSAKSEYSTTIMKIDTGWNDEFQHTDIPFGLWDMGKLAWNRKNDEKVRKIIKPFVEAVQRYVSGKFEAMSKNISDAAETQITNLSKQLENIQKQLTDLNLPDISIESLRRALIGVLMEHNPEVKRGDVQKANLFQILMGLMGMDFDIVAEGLQGKTSNVKAITKFMLKNFFEFIAWYIVAWPIGLAMIAARIWDMVRGIKKARNESAVGILMGMREATVKALGLNQEKYIMELESHLADLTSAGDTMANALSSQINDYGERLDTVLSELGKNSNILAEETERTGRIMRAMFDSLNEVNLALNGRKLTEADISQLSAGGGKS